MSFPCPRNSHAVQTCEFAIKQVTSEIELIPSQKKKITGSWRKNAIEYIWQFVYGSKKTYRIKESCLPTSKTFTSEV